MSVVRATIDIDAPPQEVWDVIMDPERFGDWVTIHRKLCRVDEGEPCREGFKMDQRLVLRGAPFTVHWTLTEVEEPKVGTFEGKGPAGSYARVTNRLKDLDGGRTCFDYENEFKAPGGVMGALASRVLVGGMPEREANRSLKQLKRLVEKESAKTR
jgi:carbon monoxide dehydrogenase subunit G